MADQLMITRCPLGLVTYAPHANGCRDRIHSTSDIDCPKTMPQVSPRIGPKASSKKAAFLGHSLCTR